MKIVIQRVKEAEVKVDEKKRWENWKRFFGIIRSYT